MKTACDSIMSINNGYRVQCYQRRTGYSLSGAVSKQLFERFLLPGFLSSCRALRPFFVQVFMNPFEK